ncbi:MAG: hypothetical protein MH137_02460 [Flavobacteriales bacterium]|nr:hypothetical protein [Flavobacteriales bacterium]
MNKLIFCTLLFFSVLAVNAQYLKKQMIANTGCSVSLPEIVEPWEITFSDDGSAMYIGEWAEEGLAYHLIAVEFLEPLTGTQISEREELFISYLDYLKEFIGVTSASDTQTGLKNPSSAASAGIREKWQTAEGEEILLCGWVNEYHLAVLYVVYTGSPEEHKNIELFLNSFEFAADKK